MKCHRQTFLQQTCACLFVRLSDSSWMRWMSLVTCFRLSEKTEGAWTCWEVCWTRFETRRRLRTPESTKQTKCKKQWQGFFWLPSVAQVNLDVGTTTWNPSFMLFETKLAGIDTFRCLRTGSKFCQSRLVCTTWICWNQFLANRIRDLFCFDRTSLNSLFWWNQNSLNGSVNWVVAVWECQRMFPVILCRWRLHCSIGCCFVS